MAIEKGSSNAGSLRHCKIFVACRSKPEENSKGGCIYDPLGVNIGNCIRASMKRGELQKASRRLVG